MTMIWGFNLEDVTYISGDTRVTRQYHAPLDNLQKIEIIKPLGIFVAAAGSVSVAAEFVAAIKSGNISIPIFKEQLLVETESIIKQYLRKIESHRVQPIDPLKPIILLFQYIIDSKVSMKAYHFTFIENNRRITTINEYVVNNNEYIKIGSIGDKAPIHIDVIPSSSFNILHSPLSSSIPFELYLEITNEIFEIAKANRVKTIGGKTTTLMSYKSGKDKYSYRGIRGYKSIIHAENDFQDVSMYTDLDIKSGIFYIRDMRKDGLIVTNIKNINGKYKFYFDSCPPDSGEDDVFYKLFSTFRSDSNISLGIMDMELWNNNFTMLNDSF